MDSLKQEVHQRLRLLAAGQADPGEVSDWALEKMESESDELRDERTWRALDRLSGADLMTGPGVYLHSHEDFSDWLREFENP
ncbi:DNA-binding protein [Streptomyces sp. RB6PN25]|uniref:DNA-binding protein n=1 Tax=Streptomyces humicola TaxID=2953240 RepID=A0ABT1Q250_9ACTN|nr:DNA-binding protein [Streptomyces humicola]MCQ4084000.1 DNA-binding protein [Streptomyces humicola]